MAKTTKKPAKKPARKRKAAPAVAAPAVESTATAAPADKKNGRPLSFTPEVGAAICQRMCEGESLLQITRDEKMPSKASVYAWLLRKEPEFQEFRKDFEFAREIMLDSMADEIVEIADDSRNDWMLKQFGDMEIEVPNKEVVLRSKLRVDTRKWLMSKVLPKKYGESATLKHANHLGDGPPVFDVDLTADERKRIAEEAVRQATQGASAAARPNGMNGKAPH